MACRVLQCGMEEFIINAVIQAAKEAGYHRVIGEYLKTSPNAMMEHIYERMVFQSIDSNLYKAIADEFKPNNTYILEENHE